MYQACAISQNNDTTVWWPFVHCMETSSDPVNAASGCATSAGIDWSRVQTCAGPQPDQGSADEGNPLMHSIGAATQSLQPPHQWTPWMVMNGRPLSSSDLGKSLKSLVCNAYTGTKPAGCTSTEAPLKLCFPGN